jgi:hypothetical protein
MVDLSDRGINICGVYLPRYNAPRSTRNYEKCNQTQYL